LGENVIADRLAQFFAARDLPAAFRKGIDQQWLISL
jgi:hypothetical protein